MTTIAYYYKMYNTNDRFSYRNKYEMYIRYVKISNF